ncbi:MAG: hypothetical protein ACE5EO_01585 [Candidatus Krumholzibacteriia bacterium]
MRKILVLFCVSIMSYAAPALAFTGVSIGGKVGYANYTGDILPASGDVGSSVLYGAVLEMATFPILDFELHVNYFSKDLTYTFDPGTGPVSGTFEFRDVHVLALAKKNLISAPMSPLGLYVGGGLGWHLINTELAQALVGNPALSGVDLFSNSVKASGHGLLGVRVSPPVFPLAVYGEARFGRIFAADGINTTEIEGGVMLKF